MEVKKNVPLSGYHAFIGHLALFLIALMCLFVPFLLGVAWLLFIVGFFAFWGYYAVEPGQAKILILFGSYKKTVTANGFYWDWPVMRRVNVSLKTRSLKTPIYHVNDLIGTPTRVSLLVHWYPENPTLMALKVEDPSELILHHLESSVKLRVRSRQLLQTPQGTLFKDAEMLAGVLDAANAQLSPNGLLLTHVQWIDCDFGPEVYERLARKKEDNLLLAQRMENAHRLVELAAKVASSMEERGLLSAAGKEGFTAQFIIAMSQQKGS